MKQLQPTPKRRETGEPETLYSAIRVRLPAFAVLIFRHRARSARKSLSAVIEGVILENVMLDELQAMAEQYPDFAQIAEDWLRWAITRKKR